MTHSVCMSLLKFITYLSHYKKQECVNFTSCNIKFSFTVSIIENQLFNTFESKALILGVNLPNSLSSSIDKNLFFYYLFMRKIKVSTLIGIAILLFSSHSNIAQVPNLGTAANFILFTIDGAVTNTAASHFIGDIGTNNGTISGFGTSVFTGNMHIANAVTAQCSIDLLSAYTQLNNTPFTNTNHTPVFGGGENLFGGVYGIGGAASVAGVLTLDAQGDSNTVFIFNIGGALTTGASTSVILANGALASRVFWIAEGAISMAAQTAMKGTLISHNAAVSMGAGCTLQGRLFSTTGAVSAYNDSVSLLPFPIIRFNVSPNLGTVANFALFTITGAITNTGTSMITGDIGTNAGAITGFETSTVSGIVNNANAITEQASTDLLNAYDQINLTANASIHASVLGNGETLHAGIYAIAAAGSLAGALVLDGQGDTTAVFIIKVGGAFSIGAAAVIILTNKTSACNVFWIAEGAISIGASSFMKGTFIAHNAAISLAAGATLEGRMFSSAGAVAVDGGTIAIAIGCSPATSWTGAINTDWHTKGNWYYHEIPTATVNVNIPSGLTNYPILAAGIGLLQNITIQNNASLLVSAATLTISGVIDNKGAFDLTAGTIEMNGHNPQSIPANTFVNNNLLNLIVSNNVKLDGLQNLTGVFSFGSSNNTFTTNGFLTLKSTAIRTAKIADLTHLFGDASSPISGNTINGTATVERYYSARRAWRLATAPLSATGSIFSTWQNGGIALAGKGTYVTGPNADSLINGLDASPLNNSSLKMGSSLIPVENTLTTTLSSNTNNLNDNADNKAFFIFVRGDRSVDNFNVANSNTTTLSSSGKLQTGNIKFDFLASDGIYNMVGNPYASPVDFRQLVKINLFNTFYTWDPYLNEDKGGYITMVGDAYDNTMAYAQSPISPSGQTSVIQSGQAFFVVKEDPAATASLKFSESVKHSAPSLDNGMQRPISRPESFRTNLYLLKPDGTTILADGNLVQFDTRFATAINNLDGIKLFNSYETFGITSGSSTLSIKRRPPLKNSDTLFFSFKKSRQLKYQFEFIPSNFNITEMAVLEDTYTGIKSPISMLSNSRLSFSVDANAASQVFNRFHIVFTAPISYLVSYTSVTAYKRNNEIAVEWKVIDELSISRYEVEKSTDGYNFTKVKTAVAASVNNSSSYAEADANAVHGVNFYRIKNINLNGSSGYSQVVKVDVDLVIDAISVYPNPATGETFGLQLANQPEGKYRVHLINVIGQEILFKEFIHQGGSGIQSFTKTKKILKGMYSVEVIKPDKSKITIRLVFQ